MADEAVVTRVQERGACFFVEGRALTPRGWHDAAFTVLKQDCAGMSRDDFFTFARRELPFMTKDIDWSRFMPP